MDRQLFERLAANARRLPSEAAFSDLHRFADLQPKFKTEVWLEVASHLEPAPLVGASSVSLRKLMTGALAMRVVVCLAIDDEALAEPLSRRWEAVTDWVGALVAAVKEARVYDAEVATALDAVMDAVFVQSIYRNLENVGMVSHYASLWLAFPHNPLREYLPLVPPPILKTWHLQLQVIVRSSGEGQVHRVDALIAVMSRNAALCARSALAWLDLTFYELEVDCPEQDSTFAVALSGVNVLCGIEPVGTLLRFEHTLDLACRFLERIPTHPSMQQSRPIIELAVVSVCAVLVHVTVASHAHDGKKHISQAIKDGLLGHMYRLRSRFALASSHADLLPHVKTAGKLLVNVIGPNLTYLSVLRAATAALSTLSPAGGRSDKASKIAYLLERPGPMGLFGLYWKVIVQSVSLYSPALQRCRRRCCNAQCGAKRANLRRCSRCEGRFYCDAFCQKKDWDDGHGAACKNLQLLRIEYGTYFPRPEDWALHMELARLVMRTQISRVTAMLSGAAKPSRAYVHVDLTMVPAIVVPLDAAEVRRMTDGRAGDEPIRQGAVAVVISTSRDGRHARDLVHMPWPLGRA